MSEHAIHFELNGDAREVTVPADRLLLDLLREDIGLTGTKEGCGIGVCGLCSVLVDGEVLSGCLVPALFVDGRAVRTIEGIASDGALTPLQEAFISEGGFQCGICTSGQIVAATALLEQHPGPEGPDEATIREWMKGNLCRCTGYYGIVRAILAAGRTRPGHTGDPA